MPRANRRLRIRKLDRCPLHVGRHIQNRVRFVLIEPPGEGDAVFLIVDPLLADGMADTQDRAAEDLAAQRRWMDDRPDIGDAEIIEHVVHARLDVHLDLGKRRDEG